MNDNNQTLSDNGRECLKCETGMNCTSQGVVLQSLVLDENYWRSSLTSTEVLACPDGSGCVCTIIDNGTIASCSEGYQGPYCSVCSEGYSKSAAMTCTVCTAGDFVSPLVIFLVMVALLGLCIRRLTAAKVKLGSVLMARYMATYHGKMAAFKSDIKTKLKIVMVFTQCMGQLPTILKVSYPPAMIKFVRTFDFDFMGSISIGCIAEGVNFHHKL